MLVLGEELRPWLLMLYVAILLISVVRTNVCQAPYEVNVANALVSMRSSVDLAVDHTLVSCERLLRACSALRPGRWAVHRASWRAALATRLPAASPLDTLSRQDPMVMLGILKGQMYYFLFQGWFGYVVSTLWPAIVVCRLPVALPDHFRSVFQRGVAADVPPVFVGAVALYITVSWSSNGLAWLARRPLHPLFYELNFQALPDHSLHRHAPPSQPIQHFLQATTHAFTGDDNQQFTDMSRRLQVHKHTYRHAHAEHKALKQLRSLQVVS